MTESIASLAASIHDLHKRAVREYTPIVAAILRSRSGDTRNIEHTLDGLLGFCGYAPIVRLFRDLCRHYYFINPVATAGYVTAYREMWDSDSIPAKAKRAARPRTPQRGPRLSRGPETEGRRSGKSEPAQKTAKKVAGK